ncbi:MAG: MFS transporter [Nitrososphaerota archaeon]|nr:MFS transporter [Nitrososphaerota archaeon]MDG6939156.1 MFS transporter [Nitrososphaerota archaeon]
MEVKTISTNLFGRLDRLPFSSFHRKVILILSAAYFLDGLESTLYGGVLGTVSSAFKITALESTLGLVLFLVGAGAGAIIFGNLADVLGRRRLFMTTVVLYGIFTALSATAFNFASLALWRTLTGIGIGGEYGAVNSALQEYLPAKQRGKWLGVMIGAGWDTGTVVASLVGFLALSSLPPALGWRIAFLVGAVLAIFILLIRRTIPESPRWLLLHGRQEEAERIVSTIEQRVMREKGLSKLPDIPVSEVTESRLGWKTTFSKAFTLYPRRTIASIILNFCETWPYYTAFTLIPTLFILLKVTGSSIPLFLIPITAVGATGALVIPWISDSIGRRPSAVLSYGLGGIMGFVIAYMGYAGALTLPVLVALLAVTYFFVFAAADILYVMIPESFPTQVRASSVGTAVSIGRLGGIIGAFVNPLVLLTFKPLSYGILVSFSLMAVVMIIGAVGGVLLGVEGKGKRLEELSEYRE